MVSRDVEISSFARCCGLFGMQKHVIFRLSLVLSEKFVKGLKICIREKQVPMFLMIVGNNLRNF